MDEPENSPYREVSGFFSAHDNLRLYHRALIPERPRAAVLLVHGYGDHSGRYLELLRHLAHRGYAAHAFDYRGHGQADGRRGYAEAFSDYLSDLDLFLAKVASEGPGLQRFLLAHSHGGLMALNYALVHPEAEVAGAVLSSPYLELAFRPPKLKVLAGKLLNRTIPWLLINSGLKLEQLTRDEAIRLATQRDPLFNRSATPRWFTESNRAQVEVRLRAPEYRWPSLFLHGSDDTIASLPAVRSLVERIGSADKALVVYEGFRHELLHEIGRERVFADIDDWIRARLK